MYSDQHKKLIEVFRNECYWNYEVRSAWQGMCNHFFGNLDFHMFRVIVSMREYWILDTCKFFDPKFSLNDRTKPNLSIDYLIDEIPWPADVKEELLASKIGMQPLGNALKEVRNKVIGHRDLGIYMKSPTKLFGAFEIEDERNFYKALLSFLNTMEGDALSAPPQEWPTFAESDAHEFMSVLTKSGYAKKM